jgi:hypothetical protein
VVSRSSWASAWASPTSRSVNMSQRLMSSLEPFVAALEVYSIDEAWAR